MDRPSLDAAPPFPLGIHVDVHSLTTFASTLERDLTTAVHPTTDRLLATFTGGVGFGRANPSTDVQGAVSAYDDCLVAVTEQLTAYVNAANVLIDAAQAIATRYASTDALAGMSTAKVTSALASAMGAANTTEPLTPGRARLT